jgi:hypothetical protein
MPTEGWSNGRATCLYCGHSEPEARQNVTTGDKSVSEAWQFLVNVCWDHQQDKSPFRAFTTEKAARTWVESEHETRWDAEEDAFRTVPGKIGEYDVQHSLGFEIADLYRILPSGELEDVDQYQTFADESGNAIGWIGYELNCPEKSDN